MQESIKPGIHIRSVAAGLKTRSPGLKVRGWHKRPLMPSQTAALWDTSEAAPFGFSQTSPMLQKRRGFPMRKAAPRSRD